MDTKTFIAFLLIMILLMFIVHYCGASRECGQKQDTCEVRFIQQYKPCEDGVGSWYGRFFHGKTMANGKRFDMNKISVAHKTLPLGTRVRVINLRNGISIEATVTDRGPYIKGRIVDMSYGAAKVLGMVYHGIVPVRIVLC
jgi:rare lipoprotein A (peptidoglycan hydrolase)